MQKIKIKEDFHFRCNLIKFTCDKASDEIQNESTKINEIQPGNNPNTKIEDVPCPGGSASCPDGNTCCQLSSGQWGW